VKISKKQIGIVAAMLTLICLTSAAIYFYRTKQYQNWRPADGVILEIQNYYNSRSRGSNHSHRIYYSYMVEERIYSGSSLYSGKDEGNFQTGESVEVWYNPEQESESSFHKPSPGLDPYAPFFLGIPLTAVVLRLAGPANKTSRRRNTSPKTKKRRKAP
jgi:hypothetical protein